MPEKPRKHPAGPRREQAIADVTLSAALLCQNVLEEKDGTLTAVRIIDRVSMQIASSSPTEPLPPLPIAAVVLLIFRKHVTEERSFTAAVVAVGPSGKETALTSLPVTIPAGVGKGQNLVLRLAFAVKDAGVYWFTTRMDGRLVSRIPLEVVITRSDATPTAS